MQVVFKDPNSQGAHDNFTVIDPSNKSFVAGDTQNFITKPSTSGTFKFSVQMYRAKGAVIDGYVDVFVGTGVINVVTPALTASNHPVTKGKTWVPIYDAQTGQPDPYEYLYLSGEFTLTAAQASQGTGLYAQYYSVQNA